MAKGIVRLQNNKVDVKTFIFNANKWTPEQVSFWVYQGYSDDELREMGIEAVARENIKAIEIK